MINCSLNHYNITAFVSARTETVSIDFLTLIFKSLKNGRKKQKIGQSGKIAFALQWGSNGYTKKNY